MSSFRALFFGILIGVLVPFWANAAGTPGQVIADSNHTLPSAQYPKTMSCLQEALPEEQITFTHTLYIEGIIHDLIIRLDTKHLANEDYAVPTVFFLAPEISGTNYLNFISSGGASCGNIVMPSEYKQIKSPADESTGYIIQKIPLKPYNGFVPSNVDYSKIIVFNYFKFGSDQSFYDLGYSESRFHPLQVYEKPEDILNRTSVFQPDGEGDFDTRIPGRPFCQDPVHKSVLAKVLFDVLSIKFSVFRNLWNSSLKRIVNGNYPLTPSDVESLGNGIQVANKLLSIRDNCSRAMYEELMEEVNSAADAYGYVDDSVRPQIMGTQTNLPTEPLRVPLYLKGLLDVETTSIRQMRDRLVSRQFNHRESDRDSGN